MTRVRSARRPVFAACVLGLVACGPAGAPGIEAPSSAPSAVPVVDVGVAAPLSSVSPRPAVGSAAADAPTPPGATPLASSASASPAFPLRLGCALPAPRKSNDACATDADCGVSEPCHASACVAKALSHPPGPTTTCTRNLVCNSADANRCGCFEGRCALIPR